MITTQQKKEYTEIQRLCQKLIKLEAKKKEYVKELGLLLKKCNR